MSIANGIAWLNFFDKLIEVFAGAKMSAVTKINPTLFIPTMIAMLSNILERYSNFFVLIPFRKAPSVSNTEKTKS